MMSFGMSVALMVLGGILWLGVVRAQPSSKHGAALIGDAVRGKRFYGAYHCYACHGYTGETGTAPHLNPIRLGQAAFIAYLRSPSTNYRDNESVYGVMPPYAADEVTDQDLADVYAYIKSLPSSSPPLKGIGLLQSTN
jgi:cytochrome c553